MNGWRKGIYVYATSLGRSGLANRLFAWAQAEVISHVHGLEMIAPQWLTPKLGPLLRGEIDLRLYSGQFSNRGYVTGLRRWWLLASAQRLSPDQGLEYLSAKHRGRRPSVITIDTVGDGFVSLAEHRELLRTRLLEVMSDRVRKRIDDAQLPERFIGVHVRRGDHGRVLQFGEAPPKGYLWNIPEEWFAACIGGVRAKLGPIPAVVFTDARPGELRHLLNIPDLRFMEAGPALADLWLLSRGSVVIGSNSTFSQWAAFLSGRHSVWYPGSLFLDFPAGWPIVFADTRGHLPPLPEGLRAG